MKWYQKWKVRWEWSEMYFKIKPTKYKSVLTANFIEHTYDWLGFRWTFIELGIERDNVVCLDSRREK